jgi:capsid protein
MRRTLSVAAALIRAAVGWVRARGWISPTEEAGAAIMRMDGALSTLEDECAEQGLEFEEVLEQRRYEIGLFKEYGIPVPEWAGQFFTASQAKQKPEPQ